MWEDFALFAAVGFLAQLVDGCIGMAFGLLGTSVLLATGMTPMVASAAVHTAEVFTTGISGFAHWRFGNVLWRLAFRLAIPGAVGGALGAYMLTTIPVEVIKPAINAYLLLMGSWILLKARRNWTAPAEPPAWTPVLGLGGGFLDAIGGGGWGPMVTSTLIGQGTAPRLVVGSVSLSEFIVTTTVSATFFGTIGLELWPIIAGLILGGALAAPLAAFAAKKIPARALMVLAASVILVLGVRGLIQALA